MISALAETVLAQLGNGVVTRAALCALTGCSEREVRAAVAELRRHGHLVISTDDGGYRMARSVEEVRAYTQTLIWRLWRLWETVAAMESSAAKHFGGCDDGGA
jgi:biotin operon repressor